MTATTATVVDLPRHTVEAAKDTHPAGGRCAAHKEHAANLDERGTQDARHRAAAPSTRRASTRTFQTELTYVSDR